MHTGGSAGDDELYGEVGDDLIRGGRGDDLLVGGNGDGTLIGRPGADALLGGPGVDTADHSGAAGRGVNISLRAGASRTASTTWRTDTMSMTRGT